MGQVWEVRAEAVAGTRRSFALKLFPHEEAAGGSDSFMAEARVAMLLTHSSVVQVFEAGDSDEGHYLVMELVDGIDLSKLLSARREEGRPIEPPTAAFIVGQVLRALHYAHELQVDGRPVQLVHRDVSPQNVMLSRSGEVKLADFGIARTALHSTTGTQVKGKLRYMAPEQLEAGPLTAAADLYAVGVLLHELISGQKFRSGRTVPELWREVADAEIPPVSRRLPKTLERVRRRLLAADPGQRFSSAEEALRMLQSWPAYRDCTFEVADLCRAYAPPKSTVETESEVGPTIARSCPMTEAANAQPLPSGRRWWPAVATVGALVAVGVAMSAWRPWEARNDDPHAGSEAAAVAADPPAPRSPAAVGDALDRGTPPPADPAVAAPVEPADSTAPDVGGAAPQRVEDAPQSPGPRPQRKRRRPQGGEHKATPPPDATVLANLRRKARKACGGDTGGGRIKIDFLIQDDGRPALVRSSAAGDPRSGCVERKVRAARFVSGTSRRSSLVVSFDP